MDKEDLNDLISESLEEMTRKFKLPLIKSFAISIYLDSMRRAGFKIDLHSEPYNFFHNFSFHDKVYDFSAKMSEEEIVDGWQFSRRATTGALYDSMHEVIDRMINPVRKKGLLDRKELEFDNALHQYRTSMADLSLTNLHLLLLDNFKKYNERILTPLNSQENQFYSPLITERLLKEKVIDLGRVNEVYRINNFYEQNHDGPRFTNAESTIAFLMEGRVLDEHTFPTNSRVEDYIWGVYLLELSKMKGYPIHNYGKEDYEGEMIEAACELGWNILNV